MLDPALVRLKFRRYETPYLATVDIQMSAQKIANIPNGFERLPKDLNAANLKIELKKLRSSAKQGGAADEAEDDEQAPAQDKQPVKKEEAKKPDPKAKPDSKAPAAKPGAQKPAETKPVVEQKEEEDDNVVAT